MIRRKNDKVDLEGKKELMMLHMGLFKKFNTLVYEKDSELNIYPGQPQFLLLIKKFPGITQKELADKNKTKPSSITGMIQRLEKLGYVERISDKEDKRIMRVYLTESGWKLANQCERFMQDLLVRLYHDFTEEEMEQHKNILLKMYNNIKK